MNSLHPFREVTGLKNRVPLLRKDAAISAKHPESSSTAQRTLQDLKIPFVSFRTRSDIISHLPW